MVYVRFNFIFMGLINSDGKKSLLPDMIKFMNFHEGLARNAKMGRQDMLIRQERK